MTGYAVFQEAFRWNDTDAYEAQVKDEDAHAWAEIYLDGLGWFPVEMTEGQSYRGNVADMLTVSEYTEMQQEQIQELHLQIQTKEHSIHHPE